MLIIQPAKPERQLHRASLRAAQCGKRAAHTISANATAASTRGRGGARDDDDDADAAATAGSGGSGEQMDDEQPTDEMDGASQGLLGRWQEEGSGRQGQR